MRGLREVVTWVGAAGLVAAVSFLPMTWQDAQSQEAGEVVPREERPIVQKRAKFYELFVNSMDVFARGTAVSCFDYQCKSIVAEALGVDDGYQLVRSVHIGRMFPSPCDETFLGINPELFVARKVQTRWMRTIGPAESPVGCFDGRLSIGVVLPNESVVEVFAAALRGTTGLRPAMADPDINMRDPEGDARCQRPYHDEGYYVGRFNLRGLVKARELLKVKVDPAQLKKFLKLYSRCPVEGTFEGTIDLEDEDDYCTIFSGQWWYDGIMKCKCRKPGNVRSRTPVLDGPAGSR